MATSRLLRGRQLLRCLQSTGPSWHNAPRQPPAPFSSSSLPSAPAAFQPQAGLLATAPSTLLPLCSHHQSALLPPWQQPHRGLSTKEPGTNPDSDEDFKPQYRKPDETTPIHQLIQQDVTQNPVMVYMKGTPAMPMCGFSGGVVQILNAYGVEFKSRNVLEDAELRQGIKTFSQWPTIPQIFVNGEFVGGCDLLFKMHQDGELEALFAKAKKASDSAAQS